MSTVQIRKATPHDEVNIIELLKKFYPATEYWRRIFLPRPWKIENDFPGYVVTTEDNIVGFLGTLFSEQQTSQGTATLGNLTSWYIEPEYRQHSMALFFEAMKLPNVTWTNLTSAPHVYAWLSRAGFKTLEDKRTYILPIPAFSRQKQAIQLKIDIEESDLNPVQRLVYQHHLGLRCRHILIKSGSESCYCLVVITKYKKIPRANIYYISNRELFGKAIRDIRVKLCRKLGVMYLVAEGNFHNNKMLGVWSSEIYPPRLYKSNVLSKEDITLLYSELFVLGF